MASPDAASDASRLLALVSSSWKTQAAHAAARLRIPDLLAGGPRRATDLALETGASEASLRRLLRALATIEIVRERSDGRFESTPMGDLLASGGSNSLRSWVLHWAGTSWPAWERLTDSVTTGRSARSLIAGSEGFGHLEADPVAAATFHRAMVELTRLVAAEFVRAVDWTGTRRIVDVGGGSGELLAAALVACPGAVGVLYDTAVAIELGREHLREAGLVHRCEFVPGDFFESVPGGADTYLLKSVLHDWDDRRAAMILAACGRAIPPDGRLLVVERIVPDRLGTGPEDQALACGDLHMLVQLGGRERARPELTALLEEAGFDLARVTSLRGTLSLLVARPASS